MNYDKYSDKLLAQQDTLSTDTIFKILIGYSWRELSQAEEANNRLEGARSGWAEEGYVSTRETRVAGKAYSLLKLWIGIKFHNDPSELNLDQSYNTEEFFTWFVEDGVLEKLENEVEEFKIPARAIKFVGYLTHSKTQEQSPANKVGDEVEDGVPPATRKKTSPRPDTITAKINHLRDEQFIPTATELYKSGEVCNHPELLKHPKIESILDMCGLTDEAYPTQKTLKDWGRKARQRSGKEAKPGRPRKK